jgi:uroporphyrinogen decarboxylase
MEIPQAQSFFGKEMIIQGNLDPVIAATDSETSLRETKRILESLLWNDHYIFNLGHGVLPETDQEILKNIVKEVHNWQI